MSPFGGRKAEAVGADGMVAAEGTCVSGAISAVAQGLHAVGLEKALATCQKPVNKGRTTTPSMLGLGGVTAGGGCAAPDWWAQDLGLHGSHPGGGSRGAGGDASGSPAPRPRPARAPRPAAPPLAPPQPGALAGAAARRRRRRRRQHHSRRRCSAPSPSVFLPFSGGGGGEGGGRGSSSSSSRAGCNE
jgi:hypothetical protein